MDTFIRRTGILEVLAAALLVMLAAPAWGLEPTDTVYRLIADDESSEDRTSDEFGYSVAVDGNFAVVGVPTDDASCTGFLGLPGSDCGAVHVYMRRDDGAWSRYRRVHAPDRYAGDRFGTSVAISGNYIVVGAPGDEGDRGATYVYRLVDDMGSWGWEYLKKLTAPDADSGDQFGYSVGISAGTTGAPPLNLVLVGAPYEEDAAYCGILGIDCGAAYVYEFSCEPTTCTWWDPEAPAVLHAGDAASFDDFGESVAVSGNYAIVGAPLDDDKGLSSGSAYVFNRAARGSWGRQKILPEDGSSLDHFGRAVAVDGARAVVGAPNAWQITDVLRAGGAYLFEADAGGTWSEKKKFTASDGKIGDHFGSAVSVSGNTVVIGARDFTALDGIDTGAAYVNAWDPRFGWKEHARIIAFDAGLYDHFGHSVALDGTTVVIGSNLYEDSTCTVLGQPSILCNYGAAYVYTLIVKDDDHDGVDDAVDNCPDKANPDQADYDGNRIGDACDPDVDGDQIKDDGDGSGVAGDNPCKGFPLVFNCDDNCPRKKNPLQTDDDKDGHGSACDACERTGPLGTVSKIDFNNWTAEGCTSCADKDFDTYYGGCDSYRTIAGIDCDDTEASIKPGGTEVCNGKDDDCDGLIDDGAGTAYYDDYDNDGYSTGNTQLFCVRPSGTAHKLASELTSTTGDCNDWDSGIHPGAQEVCDHYSCYDCDENCNGVVNEGLPSERYYFDVDGDGYARSDADGMPGGEPWVEACLREGPWLKTAAELRSITLFDCNDQDPNLWVSCDLWTCMDADWDGYWIGCDAYTTVRGPDCDDLNRQIPFEEYCDGIDNDCDGQVDEDVGYYADTDEDGYGDPATKTCDPLPGYVMRALDCNDANAQIHPSMDETCNGIDDNCDGMIDIGGSSGGPYYKDEDNDGYSDGTMKSACAGLPPGFKTAGELIAISGDCADSISTINPGAAEICNAIDDNCNGAVDEKLLRACYDADPDTMGIGPCKAGIQVCQNGQYGECRGAVVPQEEVCDLLDNDCDGTVNNNMVAASASLQQGVCQGSLKVCAMTSTGQFGWQDPIYALLPGYEYQEVTCDGRDNDCDGGVDESLTRPTTCGVGPCAGSTGAEACMNGVWANNTCNPLAGAAPETCDNIDNNCNGAIDDGIPPAGTTTCGTGDCAATGSMVCQAGSLIDTCTPGPPAPNDAICDGRDSNCNGMYDENYLPLSTTCGTGACLAAGSTTCVIGQEVNVCTPLPPQRTDAICDGIDGNCDGSVDEEYEAMTSTCGTGACASSGMLVCANGLVRDTCAPGMPVAETCDGVDNDCDGTADEGVQLTFYQDADADGYGNGGVTVLACTAPAGYTANATDCDDANAAINPAAVEVCDGKDNNCLNGIDEGVKLAFYQDGDTDGYGNAVMTTLACTVPPGYVADSTDCDDTRSNVRPGGVEVCDGLDNNCNLATDEDASGSPLVQACYTGPDGTMGIGVCKGGAQTCSNGVWAACTGQVLPVSEVCDAMDNNCNALTDEGFDNDGDMIANCFDTCPDDPQNDADTDGVCGNVDNCPMVANADQADVDGDSTGNVCDACDNRPIAGSIVPSVDTLWPPDHRMVTLTMNASSLVTHNPDTQLSITTVGIAEYSRKVSSATAGENIYDENNFEPDYAINGGLGLDLRSERAGASTGRTYTITVKAADCSGAYTFAAQVEVPHDQR